MSDAMKRRILSTIVSITTMNIAISVLFAFLAVFFIEPSSRLFLMTLVNIFATLISTFVFILNPKDSFNVIAILLFTEIVSRTISIFVFFIILQTMTKYENLLHYEAITSFVLIYALLSSSIVVSIKIYERLT